MPSELLNKLDFELVPLHKEDIVVKKITTEFPIIMCGYVRQCKRVLDSLDIDGVIFTNCCNAGISNKKEVRDFLEYMRGDVIFQKGEPLYSPEREIRLPDWKKVLQRNLLEKQKMSCFVIDRNVGEERLRKIVYEYMFRPCLYHVFHQGEFSSNSE